MLDPSRIGQSVHCLGNDNYRPWLVGRLMLNILIYLHSSPPTMVPYVSHYIYGSLLCYILTVAPIPYVLRMLLDTIDISPT